MDFYDNILELNSIDNELDGISFNFTSLFKIIDNKNGFFIKFHKLFKRSYKGHEDQLNPILENNPFNILNVSNIELDEFKMNKLYKGYFVVNFYNNKNYDLFLKQFAII